MAYYFSTAKRPEIIDNRPDHKGKISVEEAIASRRSERSFLDLALTKDQLMQLMWAVQGITSDGKRAAPSAGATYPLEIYAVAGKVEGLQPGVYRYIPEDNELVTHLSKDMRKEVAKASLDQNFIADAPLVIIIAAEFNRTTKRYGNAA
jgi:SagB-type dehydrogenase family enzyme